MDRYGPRRLRNGVIAEGGLDLRERGTRRSLLRPEDRPFRAVVVESRVVDEEGNVRGLSVECDVILVRTQIAIQNVPVLQRQHGVNNVHDLWVPRGTTRIVGDNEASLNLQRTHSRRGAFIGPGTPLGDVDGDHVLVDFIEGNQDYPIIVGALPHERSNRIVRTGDGWREGDSSTRGHPRRDEFYVHHYGAELRVNEQGDVLIDTVGAYTDPATEDAGAASGQVRIRVKDGQRLTVAIGDDEDTFEVWKDGGQLRIDLGEGAAERLVLGDSFRNFINAFFADTFDKHTHEPGAFVAGGTAVTGVSGPPTSAATVPPVPPTQHFTGTQMSEDVLSDLAKTKKT